MFRLLLSFLGIEIPSARMWRELDLMLLGLLFALVGFGFVTLYGASPEYAARQMRWIAIGVVTMLLLLFASEMALAKAAPFFYGVALLLLIYVLSTPEIKGARSWIRVGTFRFQPSEFTKIVVTLLVARLLSRFTPLREAKLWPGLGALVAVCAPPLGLIVIQPDLGTAFIFCLTIVSMMWAAQMPRRLLVAIVLWAILLGVVGYPHLKPYQKQRLTSFLNPERDPRQTGYQVIQARITQGSGRLFGKGWGQGTQTEYRFLPEFHNDFIFSSLGEQFGLVGSVACVALFFVFIARCYGAARKTRNLFGAYAIVGLTTIVGAHTAINLGMSLGLLPVMGLPLPFFSYGGSFMLTNFAIVGLILNLRMRRHLF